MGRRIVIIDFFYVFLSMKLTRGGRVRIPIVFYCFWERYLVWALRGANCGSVLNLDTLVLMYGMKYGLQKWVRSLAFLVVVLELCPTSPERFPPFKLK